MPPSRPEPNATGIPGFTGSGRPGAGSAPAYRKPTAGSASMDVPHVRELSDAIAALKGQITGLQAQVNAFSGKHLTDEYNKITAAAMGAAQAGGQVGAGNGNVSLGGSRGSTRTPAPSTPFGGNNNPVVQGRPGFSTPGMGAGIGSAYSAWNAGASPGQAAASGARAMSGGGAPPPSGGFGAGQGGGMGPPMGGGGGGGGGILGGMGTAYSAAGGGSAGLIAAGISGVLGGISKGLDLLGAITSAGVQYVNNRIEGPTGNRNAMMALSQSLAPIATTTGLTMQDVVKGLSQKSPVQGSLSDISSTILAGNAVGAQLKGTPGRNGFFQGVREMQTLTPGIGSGQLAGTLANYMGNTGSQQMGAFYGGGAFTMMGSGGRYKSLGEWAQGITEFFKQQRPGKDRGKEFTKADLMAQNFPGSNVNAWFQMMGVPQDMVDYWWQYVLTKAQAGSSGTGPFDLQGAVTKQRGQDLGAQRLDTITQATRRDFLMGSDMYGAYGVKENADKRFNVAMQKADLDVAKMATNTNVGMIMSMLPTSVSDLLMPILTKMAGSKLGATGSMVGMTASLLHAPGSSMFGDPEIGDVGDYGAYGSTSTAHMTPGLAKKVAAMQRANPKVKITSGYRDMNIQQRLGKKGVGKVSGKPGAHTKGWAADLGPNDQLGWINANAHRFGLQTAHNQGEPWHTQESGTMHVGDPTAIGDFWGSLGGSLLSVGTLGISDMVQGNMPFTGLVDGVKDGVAGILGGGGDILKSIVESFLGGKTTDDKINNAIALFIQTMLDPALGLADVFGQNHFSNSDVADIIGKPTSISFKLPRYGGFEPSDNPAGGKDIFGDPPVRPSLPRFNPHHFTMPTAHLGGMGGGTVFQVEVHVPVSITGSGSSEMDARRTASVLEPHIEQAARRALAAAGGRT